MNQNSHTTPPGYPPDSYGFPGSLDFQEENQINWRKYFFLFLGNWYWFLITLGIALSVAFLKVRYTIPQYQATAKLIIEQEESSQDMINQLRAVRYWIRQADLANETAKLTSFATIKRAVDSLEQDIFWTAHGRIRVRPLFEGQRFRIAVLSDTVDWFKNQEWYIDYIDQTKYRLYKEESIDTILPLGIAVDIKGWKFATTLVRESGHLTYSFIVNDPVVLSRRYKGKLSVEYDEETGSTITLRSIGPVGEREVEFLNTLSQIYILSELERKQTIADNTFTFIDDQIVIILDSLKRAESQLLTFRLSNNVINLSREGEMAYERLKSFTEQRTSLELMADYYKYLISYIEQRNDPQTIIAPTLVDERDQLLIAAVKDLQELYKERESLELSVNQNNPGIERINERISSARIRIVEIVNGLIENNRLTLEQIKTEEEGILYQLSNLPVNEQQLLNIKRKYDLYNQFYTFLLQKRAEAGIQKASTITNVRILDQARNDHLVGVGSNKRMITLVSILLGLLFPVVILLLRNLLDNRIREREDITNHTNIPILGVIGHSLKGGSLKADENLNSPFIESLRRIRTNLHFMLRQENQNVIMVTSGVSREGKTFTATNLAIIQALNNKKVLLIDCDLRKPSLHKIFQTKNTDGLSTFLIREKTFQDCVIKTYIPNLELLPSGPIPPNPAELLDTREMKDLILKLKDKYDYIILDTPPVAIVSDSLTLADYSDITLYVVRQNYSRKDVINIANQMSSEKKLQNLGLLINDIKASRTLGYNYYYGYNKGYNYGYYNYSNYYTKEADS